MNKTMTDAKLRLEVITADQLTADQLPEILDLWNWAYEENLGLLFNTFKDATISLMDIDAERLEFAQKAVPNTGLINNLPEEVCVEVPVEVDKAGFHPIHVGALPPENALITQLSSGIEELAVQASLAGDPTLVYRAICHDPLIADVLSLA